jgi:hypothetical protein
MRGSSRGTVFMHRRPGDQGKVCSAVGPIGWEVIWLWTTCGLRTLERSTDRYTHPTRAEVGYNQLMFQLRTAWLAPRRLPVPIRDLFLGRARLTSLECGVLEAFVEEELAKHKHTSGIPPPQVAEAHGGIGERTLRRPYGSSS